MIVNNEKSSVSTDVHCHSWLAASDLQDENKFPFSILGSYFNSYLKNALSFYLGNAFLPSQRLLLAKYGVTDAESEPTMQSDIHSFRLENLCFPL